MKKKKEKKYIFRPSSNAVNFVWTIQDINSQFLITSENSEYLEQGHLFTKCMSLL